MKYHINFWRAVIQSVLTASKATVFGKQKLYEWLAEEVKTKNR